MRLQRKRSFTFCVSALKTNGRYVIEPYEVDALGGHWNLLTARSYPDFKTITPGEDMTTESWFFVFVLFSITAAIMAAAHGIGEILGRISGRLSDIVSLLEKLEKRSRSNSGSNDFPN